MRNAKNLLSMKALKFIYYSIFHSHVIYGIQAWSTCAESKISEIYKKQKKAIRIINNASYNSHTESLFKKSQVLPLPLLIKYFKLQFMQHYMQGFLPKLYDNVWITAESHFNSGDIQYALRNRENFYIPICRLATLDKHPYFYFPKLWQDFEDENLKIIRDKQEFKNKLKEYFLNTLSSNYTCSRLLCPNCHIRVDSSDTMSDGSS